MDKYTSREVNRDGGGKNNTMVQNIFFLKEEKYVERSPPNYRHNRNSRSRKRRELGGEGNDNKRAWSRGINGVLCGHVSIYVKKRIFLCEKNLGTVDGMQE